MLFSEQVFDVSILYVISLAVQFTLANQNLSSDDDSSANENTTWNKTSF